MQELIEVNVLACLTFCNRKTVTDSCSPAATEGVAAVNTEATAMRLAAETTISSKATTATAATKAGGAAAINAAVGGNLDSVVPKSRIVSRACY